MAFVGQGAKQPVLACFLAEHDCANRSSKASSSILEKPSFHEDITVQVCAPACISKGSTAEPTLHSSDSPAIPHWMSSKQVQNILVNTSAKSGLTSVVPSTPMPKLLRQNSQIQETLGSFCGLPPPRLTLGSEGPTNTGNGVLSRPNTPDSRHLFQQQLPARSPLSVGLSPSQGFKRDEQREELKVSKKDLLSLLSLGQSAGKPSHQSADDVSSWVSKFPFQIAPTLEEAGERHSSQLREPLGHRMVSELNIGHFTRGSCGGVVNVPSQLVGSNIQIDHSNFLAQHSPSPTKAANYVRPQKTIPSLANSSLKSPLPLPATLTGFKPSLKRDWNATLMQCIKHPQLLPDFFAQQKVASSAKADQCPRMSEKNPEMKSTVFSSQKGLAPRIDEENVRLKMNGAFCSDRTRNSSLIHESFKQQDFGCGREAVMTRAQLFEQNLGNSRQHMDLPKVKNEMLGDDSENAECGELAQREFTENHDKIATLDGRLSSAVPLLNGNPAADQAARQASSITSDKVGMRGNSQSAELMVFRDSLSTPGLEMSSIASACVPLFTDSASSQGLGASSTVSARVPSLPFLKQSQNLKSLERGTADPANKYAQIVGNWGEFFAAPSIGQTAETDAKIMLPFQQRFMQLQKFLKKCDGSDKDYCLQALRSLSTTARSEHAAELESRAVKLSLEEGKEMKRAKLLHVLEESPEGKHMNPCKRPMGPWFSVGSWFLAPKAAAVVREEA